MNSNPRRPCAACFTQNFEVIETPLIHGAQQLPCFAHCHVAKLCRALRSRIAHISGKLRFSPPPLGIITYSALNPLCRARHKGFFLLANQAHSSPTLDPFHESKESSPVPAFHFPLSTSPVSAHHHVTFRHGRRNCTVISRSPGVPSGALPPNATAGPSVVATHQASKTRRHPLTTYAPSSE